MWLHYFLILYILLLGLLLGTDKQNRIKKTIFITLTFGLFIIIAAFRAENVGNDTSEYLRVFTNLSLTGDISGYTWRYEKGYLYLNKLLGLLVSHSQIILIVTSIIIMLGFARFISKYSRIYWLSTYLFFTLGYFGMSMNTIRQYLAMIIIFFAYDYLRKRKLLGFVLIIFLASLFHKTALAFLLAWPITKFRFNYKSILTITISSVILYISFQTILQGLLRIFPTYQYYLDSSYLNGDIRIATIMNLLVGLSIIVFGVFIQSHNNSDLKYKNCFFCEREKENNEQLMLLLIGVCMTFISIKFNLLDRIGDYFLVFSCIYLTNVIDQIKGKKLAILLIYIIVVLFFLYVTTIQVMRPEWNTIYPYKFFWMN